MKNNDQTVQSLLVELLAQVNRVHERLDNMNLPAGKELTVSDDIAWQAMFEHMVYTVGKYTHIPRSMVDVYEGISNDKDDLFVTPKVYGMLAAKVRRVSTGTPSKIKSQRKVGVALDDVDTSNIGEMLTVPGPNCIYAIRYSVDQSTKPAIKKVTHVVTITSDRRGMGKVTFEDDFAGVVKKAYMQF